MTFLFLLLFCLPFANPFFTYSSTLLPETVLQVQKYEDKLIIRTNSSHYFYPINNPQLIQWEKDIQASDQFVVDWETKCGWIKKVNSSIEIFDMQNFSNFIAIENITKGSLYSSQRVVALISEQYIQFLSVDEEIILYEIEGRKVKQILRDSDFERTYIIFQDNSIFMEENMADPSFVQISGNLSVQWAFLALDSSTLVYLDRNNHYLTYFNLQTFQKQKILLLSQHTLYDKVNETFVLLGVSSALPHLLLFDLKKKVAVFWVEVVVKRNCENFLTIFYHNQKILFRTQCRQNNLDIIQIQPSRETFENENPTCPPPFQILDQYYCVLCEENCLQCDPLSPSKCLSCTFGFDLNSRHKCVPATFTIQFHNFISFPIISSVFLFLENYFKFLDNVWLFQFHNMTYGENVKSLLKYIRQANQAKFFPTFIQKPQTPLFSAPENSRRDEFTFFMYKHIVNKNAYFLGNAEDMYLWGALSSIATLLLFFIIGKCCKNTFLIVFFGRYQTFAFCFSQFIEPRISTSSFLFFTQVQAGCSADLKEKISLILCTFYFFVILVYSFSSYSLYRYFYQTKDKTLVLCKHFKNCPKTFYFFTYCNIQLIIQAFIHAFLFDHSTIQLVLLLLTTIVGFMIAIKLYLIFESSLHFFVYVFYYISRALFLVTLILFSEGATEILTVDIDIITTILLFLLFFFSLLKIVSNLIVFFYRLFANMKRYLEEKKTHVQETEILHHLLQDSHQKSTENQTHFFKRRKQQNINLQNSLDYFKFLRAKKNRITNEPDQQESSRQMKREQQDDDFVNEVLFGGNRIHPENKIMEIKFIKGVDYDF